MTDSPQQQSIPAEAVEAAHRAWREQAKQEGSIFEYNLRAALEAAAPHIAREALRMAADELEDRMPTLSGDSDGEALYGVGYADAIARLLLMSNAD